jgi:hypothetical protein
MDWKARLDGDGQHLTAIERPSVFVRWATDADPHPDPEEDGYVLGAAIEASGNADFSGELLHVKVGDAVYLTGARKGQPAEIHRVEELVQVDRPGHKKHGTFWLQGTSFWRARRLKFPDSVDWHFSEVLLCMRTEDGENVLDMTENSPNDFLELKRVRRASSNKQLTPCHPAATSSRHSHVLLSQPFPPLALRCMW